MKCNLFTLIVLIGFWATAQENPINSVHKLIQVKNDTIKIDSISISSYKFKLLDHQKKEIDTTKYDVDFAKSILIIKDSLLLNKELNIVYRPLPKFLTKTYQAFDKKLIVNNTQNLTRLYHTQNNRKSSYFKPFDGLETNGSISRGITIGNNQDGVLNSNFDLQITGKLSSKVGIRANITDSNVPQQNNGYTQRLNEFDKIFIELYSEKWKVIAGDIDLENNKDYFLNFNKKVAGLALETGLNHKNSSTELFASAALVKGKYTEIDFQGQEANQGPYKLTNINESFLLIISGTETVYIDGIPLKRGESNDYLIDYNAAEITFNTTFPITSDMRIHVEFQVSDENFTRFITHNTANYQSSKFKLKMGVYSESDSKNQTLQQDLNDAQIEVLSNAGDDTTLMITESAVQESFIENKIQYKKETQNGIEIFVFSTTESDELFAVKFSFVGQNLGDYNIQTTIATGRIYEYVAPIGGVKQGSYNPVFQLVAPNKLQIANLVTDFNPNKKIQLHSEFAYSINDKNLFSNLADNDNTGYAGKLNYSHLLIDKKWKLSSLIDFETIHEDFNTIEEIQNIEFNRDWNLENPLCNFNKYGIRFLMNNDSIASIKYQINHLEFNKNFKGTKQQFNAIVNRKKIIFRSESSLLNSESSIENTSFLRSINDLKYRLNKAWFGGKILLEENKRKVNETNILSNLSHKFIEYETFVGVGDSTKVFVEIGYKFRTNDSIKFAKLEKVSTAKTYFINAKLIQNKKANLAIYANYRTIANVDFNDEKSLNTRLNYRQQLFDNFVNLNTVFETSNGALPQQDFSYVEVEPGQGFYKWIDYNENGIQELEEFEIAQFQDQAIYLRVLLPSTQFIKTNRNKLSQVFNLNFSKWSTKKGLKKGLSHFINQTNILIDSKKKQEEELINVNPFKINDDHLLALNFSFKNSLFFNRGKQKYSTTYSVFNLKNRNVFVTGTQENNLSTHQLQFQHKLGKYWLLDLKGKTTKNESKFENFITRNFELKSDNYETRFSYFHNKNTKLESFYILKYEDNKIGLLESLESQQIGINFQYAKSQKLSLSTTFSLITNDFNGEQNSPVAFQMLDGLQNGKNLTWNFLLQKKLTSYLDINLNYNGRKSESSKVIHVGTVQLRANF